MVYFLFWDLSVFTSHSFLLKSAVLFISLSPISFPAINLPSYEGFIIINNVWGHSFVENVALDQQIEL